MYRRPHSVLTRTWLTLRVYPLPLFVSSTSLKVQVELLKTLPRAVLFRETS